MPSSDHSLGKPEILVLGLEVFGTCLGRLWLSGLLWTFWACSCGPTFPLWVKTSHSILIPEKYSCRSLFQKAVCGLLSTCPHVYSILFQMIRFQCVHYLWAILTLCKLCMTDDIQSLSDRNLIGFLSLSTKFQISTKKQIHNFVTYLVSPVTLL